MKNPRFLPRLAAGLFTLTAGTLPVLTSLTLTPAAARAQEEAGAQEVSFDFFYNGLAENGDWYNTPDFGYVFQPYIAYKNENWRPYTDGYWAQTDQGWTWVSYEDFGWACYHYGRWSQLENVGWVWVPGYEWGPGWVSWRTSNDYIGWAPLPPKATARVASTTVERGGSTRSNVVEEEGRPEDAEEDYDTGYNGGVDAQYDIGPGQYSFVPVQSFGAPYLSEAVVPVAQNVVIIGNTDNVTNIVYRRGPRDNRVIYCGGPDYAYISRRTERPIPRLLLERRTDVTPDRSGPRADRFNVVRDNRLEFFAPVISQRAVNFNQVRPARVKENLTRPQIVHGWRGAQQQDPGLADRLRERFQQQARQAPPARQGVENFVTPAAFRAQPPPSIQEQQRLHQPPPPRTREGGDRPGAADQPPAAVTTANQPPAPAPGPVSGRVNGRPPQGPPAAPGLQPVPNPGGRNLTDAERQARRDARQREIDQRQGTRPGGAAQPVNPPASPNVANRPDPVAPAPATPTAPGQPAARPNRPDAEREAPPRTAKQQAREQAAARPAQTPPPAPAEGNNPAARPPGQPFQAPPAADPDRAAKRDQKRERAAARPETPSPVTPPAPTRDNGDAERARGESRGPRVREPQAPPQAQQQQQEAIRQQRRAETAPEQPREQRRPERPPQAERAAPPQAQQAEQARAREAQAQQAQRQAAPPRQAPPPQQQRPQAQPQPQPQPGQNPGEERKKRGDKQGD